MTKNLPQGQNSIWKIEPGVKIWYENWPQFTMGFKIPWVGSLIYHRQKIQQNK
jgi:hypothetical protein